MYKWRFTDNKDNEWERITKTQARAAYDKGLTVLFCPVNLRPFGAWRLDMKINKSFWSCDGLSFESVLDSFEYYNCDKETGKYAAFYIQVKGV